MLENDLRFIKDVIYALKRSYGGPVDIYQNVIDSTNLETGERVVSKNKWHIKKAIRLPRDIHRDAIFSTTGNRVFAYGNIVELADREVIVDRRDLPSDFVMGSENWYMIIDNHHYEIKRHSEFDNKAAIYFILKELTGAPREAVIEQSIQSDIQTQSETTL
jgi:hypothetical protein